MDGNCAHATRESLCVGIETGKIEGARQDNDKHNIDRAGGELANGCSSFAFEEGGSPEEHDGKVEGVFADFKVRLQEMSNVLIGYSR